MKKRYLAAVCVAALSLAQMVLGACATAAPPPGSSKPAASAHPVTENGAFTMRNVATGGFITAGGAAPGVSVGLTSTVAGIAESVQIAAQQDGTVQLRAVNSGACLTPQPNGTVVTAACGQASQGFVASRQSGGLVFTQKVSGLVLTAVADGVQMAPARSVSRAWALSASGHTRIAVNARGNADGGPAIAANTTLRMKAYATGSGDGVRVTLTNQFGLEALVVDSVTVAVEAAPGEPAATPVQLTFSGAPGASIPTGRELASDASSLSAQAGQTILVSLHLAQPVSKATWHPLGIATTYFADGSDQTMASTATAFTRTTTSTYFLRTVDLASTQTHKAVVALGDSITDGAVSPTDGNQRWPDQLSQRLRANGAPVASVVNVGISANKVAYDRGLSAGPAAIKRFDLDVVQQMGVTDVIIYEGINDVDDGETAAEITGAMTELVRQARAADLKVHIATLPPFKGWKLMSANEEPVRVEVNSWIRANSVKADSVQDFDVIMRDPATPDLLNPAFDSGDHLHPNVAGFAAIVSGLDYRRLDW